MLEEPMNSRHPYPEIGREEHDSAVTLTTSDPLAFTLLPESLSTRCAWHVSICLLAMTLPSIG
jgi:hypothetical protein